MQKGGNRKNPALTLEEVEFLLRRPGLDPAALASGGSGCHPSAEELSALLKGWGQLIMRRMLLG